MHRTSTGTGVKARAEIGRLGGLACFKKHGREFYREIGKKGYQATLARYWQGDALAYRRWLVAKGWNVVADALADREIDRRLAEGESTVCMELPYLDDVAPQYEETYHPSDEDAAWWAANSPSNQSDEPPDSYWDELAEEAAWMDRYENGWA